MNLLKTDLIRGEIISVREGNCLTLRGKSGSFPCYEEFEKREVLKKLK